MPEICEITLTAQYLLSKLKNRYITGIHVIAGKYTHTELIGKKLISKHQQLKIINVNNKGKLMWIELQNPNGEDIFIINNFGLTANWSFYTDKSDRIIFDIETHPDQPKKNKKCQKFAK